MAYPCREARVSRNRVSQSMYNTIANTLAFTKYTICDRQELANPTIHLERVCFQIILFFFENSDVG
jgi:hypothetical protein